LPAPDVERPDQPAPFVAPATETEMEVAALWKRLLHLDQIGIDDNFFDLGGHSLLALQLLAELRARTGVELSLQDLFAIPTVRALADRIEEELIRLSGGDLDRMLNQLEAMDEVEAERLLDQERHKEGQEDR
jgi:acyl carrier protein